MDIDFYQALEYLEGKKLRDKVENQSYEIRRCCRDRINGNCTALELIERAYILGYAKGVAETLGEVIKEI